MGSPYANNHISFTINDDTTDFAVGDKFTVDISEGSGKFKQIDFSAVDGSGEAEGLLFADCDATNGDKEAVIVSRDAIIVSDYLVWPEGVTTDQKSAALSQLKDKGIVDCPGQ